MTGVARDGKITLFMTDLEGGGAERSMLDLARGFVGRGRSVDLVLASAQGALLNQVPEGVNLIDLAKGSALRALPDLVRYLRRERPSAALSTLPHSCVVLVWARLLAGVTTRVVLREATTPSSTRPEDRGAGLRARLVPFAMRRFYPMADAVVAVSEGVARDLERYVGVPAAKLVTIHNPVVGADLIARSREPIEEPWLTRQETPVVLSAGRLRPEKDFPTLLRAFAIVRRRRRVRLLILGEGAERPQLERLAEQLGIVDDVRMPGFVPNPLPYMASASLYVLPSKREGLPGALIQAIACGCPVVSTDCPSGPREVLDDGRFGELVPVGDAEAMAEAMIRTLEDPPDREILRERGRYFSEERSVEAYLELLSGRGTGGSRVVGKRETAVQAVRRRATGRRG